MGGPFRTTLAGAHRGLKPGGKPFKGPGISDSQSPALLQGEMEKVPALLKAGSRSPLGGQCQPLPALHGAPRPHLP